MYSRLKTKTGLNPTKKKEFQMTKKESTKQEIATILSSFPVNKTVKNLKKDLFPKIPQKTVISAVKELVEEGTLLKSQDGKKITYSYIHPLRLALIRKRGWKAKESRKIFSKENVSISRKELGFLLQFDSKNTHMTIANLRREGYVINWDRKTNTYSN
jgi:hypothetical protein